MVAGGWYHVVNWRNRREPIFRTDTDRRRFLGRLAELPERFRIKVLFPCLSELHEKHQAKLLNRRCRLLGIKVVTLHSYRYAWACARGSAATPSASPRRRFVTTARPSP